MYRFLENFETGIPFIDNGHRRLLEDMEEAREALAAGHEDDFHRLSDQLLTTMQEHIVKQHVYEEEIMAMSRDTELDEQKEAHAHFKSVIEHHRSSMNFQNDREELTDLLHFLNDWFLQHILSSDVLIGSALKKAKAAAVKAKAQAAKEARAAEAAQAEAAEKAAKEAAEAKAAPASQPREEASVAEIPSATAAHEEAAPPSVEPAAQATEKPATSAKKPTKKRAATKKKVPAEEVSSADAPAADEKPKKATKKSAAAKPAKAASAAPAAPAKAAPTTDTAASKKASEPATAAAPAPAAPPKKSPAPAAKPKATIIKTKKAPADPFAFTDEFRTQIPLVDKEHETLFDLVRQTYELVHDEFRVDKFDDIIEIIEELRDYTIKHFADEERYMKSINYDGLAEQVAAHTAFVEKLNNIDFDEIDRDQEDALDKLIKFLLNWLVQHILKVDKKMPYVEDAALKLTE